jgi:two-component sensor histidine kinase
MSEILRVLQVEDSALDAAMIVRHLEKSGYVVHSERVEEAEPMRQALARQKWDVILADYQLPQFEAAEALGIRNECACDVPFIIVSGIIGEDRAVEMMLAGAQDYVLKDRIARLAPAVQREIREARVRRDRCREYRRVASLLRDKEQSIEQRAAEKRQYLDENTALSREVSHRVRNNLQIIGSLLSMQIACMGHDDRFTAPLHKAHHRVLALALAHEELFLSGSHSDLNFADYIASLSKRLYFAYCADPIRIRLETFAEPIHLKIDDALNCGLILNELLDNSLKHAFPEDRAGHIQVRFRKIGPARVELSVVDNGVGLPTNFRYQDVPSLGLKMVSALIAQLQGNLRVSGSGGTAFIIDWDLEVPDSYRQIPLSGGFHCGVQAEIMALNTTEKVPSTTRVIGG